MNVRLYKEPHCEPFTPDVARLLFEGMAAPDTDMAERIDFYISAWIRGMTHLESFQAVLGDAISLIYRSPRFITIGKIGSTPINRAILRTDSVSDKDIICTAMRDLHSEQFPGLIEAIRRITQGEDVGYVELTTQEKDNRATLMKKVRT